MTLAFEDRPYRPGVGLMVLDRRGRVFVGRRIDQVAEAWQMPQGGIDMGEDALAAALRECAEEIGTANVELLAESADWHAYDLPEPIADKVWHGRYRGQTQKWFALRFLGADHEIDVTQVAEPEFDAWRWVGQAELIDLIAPFKRDLYRRVVAEFAHLLG